MGHINNETKKIEEILSTCVSIAYLEIIMFENFKDECEMCYEKSERALKRLTKNDDVNEILEKARNWINEWLLED